MLHLLPAVARAAETLIVLEGVAPSDGPDHFRVPFEVPEGTVEIEIRHDDGSDTNILDWGLDDPDGFRGWGGGNTEPAIVSEAAASRSYLPGPIPAGSWSVVVGRAKVLEEATWRVEIVLRDEVTLPAQPEREPYAPAVLSSEARWYAGDLHVHSRESGDARPPLDEIATFARSRGLDFVVVTDHNTNSQLDFFVDAQGRHPELLLVPGVEFTTYDGHANGVGATDWVDHKIGQPGVTIEGAAAAFRDQGAVFSINHPALDLGNACIGCGWAHPLDGSAVDAVEIATGGWSQSGFLFGDDAIAFWEALCADGHHVAAIGGSDDHRAGAESGAFQSPIGDPTTMIFAEALSADAIVQAIRDGRTVVKLQGPEDPMVSISSEVSPAGDTVEGPSLLEVTVTGGVGAELRLIRDGALAERFAVDADPYAALFEAAPPAEGEGRWRAEVWVDGAPRTITSHLWVRAAAVEPGGRCGCGSAGSGGWAWGLAALAVGARRRRPS